MSKPTPEAIREEWKRLVHHVTDGDWDESFESIAALAVNRRDIAEYAALRAEVERLREAIRAASDELGRSPVANAIQILDAARAEGGSDAE